MTEPQLCLASRSPRRRLLLEQIGVAHELVDVEVDECWDGRETARAHVVRLAIEKARLGRRKLSEERPWVVLAADTVVVLDDQILGKAEQRHEAVAMLRQLSGRSHWVYSGIAAIDMQCREHSAVSVTRVIFQALSAEQIHAYVESGEPLGKAGAYAIQGRAAGFIERIEGSYSGVMGLPLFETVALLRAAGIAV